MNQKSVTYVPGLICNLCPDRTPERWATRPGVDVATSEPFELSMKKMNRLMNEMESMLDKKK